MNVKHENRLSMFYSEKNRNCCSKHKRLFFIAGDIIQYFNCSNILNGLRLRLRCCRRRFTKAAAASCQWISTSECETETKSTTDVKNFNRFSTCVCLFVLLIFLKKKKSIHDKFQPKRFENEQFARPTEYFKMVFAFDTVTAFHWQLSESQKKTWAQTEATMIATRSAGGAFGAIIRKNLMFRSFSLCCVFLCAKNNKLLP